MPGLRQSKDRVRSDSYQKNPILGSHAKPVTAGNVETPDVARARPRQAGAGCPRYELLRQSTLEFEACLFMSRAVRGDVNLFV